MGKRRYAVDLVRDDGGLLRDMLHQIGEGGGKVISITWQPSREINLDAGKHQAKSGYTVVSEYGDNA